MTKRYYYTDPLAAAWMVDNFKMKFEYYCPIFKRNHVTDYSIIFCHHLIEIDKMNHSCVPRKYHIHPDSVHILNPQVGDLIKDTDNEYQIVWEDHKGLGVDTSKGTESPVGMKIIQRNNTAFMWPEVEEINDEL